MAEKDAIGPLDADGAVDIEKNASTPILFEQSSGDNASDIFIDSKFERRSYRRIDGSVITMLFFLYFFTAAIRAANNFAMVMNKKDSIVGRLGLSARDLSLGSALFWVAYVIFEIPSNIFMSLVLPNLWICRLGLSIGIVSCFHALLGNSSATGYKAIRFFLGACEAGFWPGIAFYCAFFYSGKRLSKRIAWIFMAAHFSSIVMSPLSVAFERMNGRGGLFGFEWMYLILGITLIALSVISYFVLPIPPLQTAVKMAPHSRFGAFHQRITQYSREFLSKEEKQLITQHVKFENTTRLFRIRDIWSIFRYYKIWCLIVMYFGAVGFGNGLQNYLSLILKHDMRIDPKIRDNSAAISYLQMPVWGCDIIGVLLGSLISDYLEERCFVFIGATVIEIVGLIIATAASSATPWVRYTGLLIAGLGLGATFPVIVAWAAEITRARFSVIACSEAIALISSLGNLGSVLTTYALYVGWPKDVHFTYSNIVVVCILTMGIFAALIIRFINIQGTHIGAPTELTCTDSDDTEATNSKVRDESSDKNRASEL